MPSLAFAGAGARSAMLAVAARDLGWPVVAVAGAAPERLAAETGAAIVSLAELVGAPPADIVVVDTPGDERAGHAAAVLARGAAVVMSPGLRVDDAQFVFEVERASPATLVMADFFPTAPPVQRWFAELAKLGGPGRLAHLSGRVRGDDLDWPLLSVAVLSARLAGWGDPTGATTDGDEVLLSFASGPGARLTIDTDAAPGPAPEWALQAADADHALRVEMLPRPGVERDGEPLGLPVTRGPAETFGAAPLLRAFWADVEAGRRPVLDAAFGLGIERLRPGRAAGRAG